MRKRAVFGRKASTRRWVVGAVAGLVGVLSAAGVGATLPVYSMGVGATLVFEADGVDGGAGTRILVGAQEVTTLAESVDDFQVVRVPVAPALLNSGRVDVRFVAGTQATDGLDEFALRNVRLELGGGVVATDPRHALDRAYRLGDGVDADPAWGNPHGDVPGVDRLGHVPFIESAVEVRSPLIATRTFRFDLPAPATSTTPTAVGTVTAAAAGEAFSKPHDPAPGVTPVTLEPTDLAALTTADGIYLETTPEQGFASQEFLLHLDEAARQAPHARVTWRGHSSDGRGATLYAWDRQLGIWVDVATVDDAASDTTISGVIDTATMVDDAGDVRLLVQERKFADSDTDFAFAWMTDTQFYSERYANSYDAMSQWIVDNAAAQRIVYGIHTGDIGQNYNVPPAEWLRASESMAILEDGGVPYGITTGNHDLMPDGSREGLQFDVHFPVSRFEDMASEHVRFGGAFDNYQNHYDLVETAGVKLLVLYLAHGTNDADVAWANSVLAEHPDHAAILATHQYIDPAAAYGGTGERVLNDIIVPNDNVIMMLCGHYTGSVYNVRRFTTAEGEQRIAYEILHDYQGGDDGGNGYLKLLRFDVDAMQMDMVSYSPIADEFDNAADAATSADRIAEADDDVTLALDLHPVSRRLATDSIAVESP